MYAGQLPDILCIWNKSGSAFPFQQALRRVVINVRLIRIGVRRILVHLHLHSRDRKRFARSSNCAGLKTDPSRFNGGGGGCYPLNACYGHGRGRGVPVSYIDPDKKALPICTKQTVQEDKVQPYPRHLHSERLTVPNEPGCARLSPHTFKRKQRIYCLELWISFLLLCFLWWW